MIDLSTIWNGAYGGLCGEVVDEDCYRVKGLDFIPEVVIDLGANVGTFTKMAHELWPDAQIIAVEPDPQNCEYFIQNIPDSDHIHLIQAAIGEGEMFRCTWAINGAHECYVSAGLGFKIEQLWADKDTKDGIKKVNIRTTRLTNIVDFTKKFIVKIDIEGAESVIFTDPIEMLILSHAEYIAMELHYHALEDHQMPEVREKTKAALEALGKTHDCTYEHPMFYARKRKI